MKKDLKKMPYYLVRLRDEKEVEFLNKLLEILDFKITNELKAGQVPVMIRKDRKEALIPQTTTMAGLVSSFGANTLEENILTLEDFVKKYARRNEEKTF